MAQIIKGKHLLLAAAAAIFVTPGAALAQSVNDQVEEVQEQANELREATNELNETLAAETGTATEDGTRTDRTDRAEEDDDGDEGKWGLLGLLGLAGLLGLRRRDDHRHDHRHDDHRMAGTTRAGASDTDRRL